MDRQTITDLSAAFLPRACASCGLRADDGVFCKGCRAELMFAPDESALFIYERSIKRAVRRAKFGPDLAAARALGRLFNRSVNAAVQTPITAVTFVPASLKRVRERGFDLPALLARAAARRLRVPLVEALAVTRHDAPLSSRARTGTREDAVRGRFASVPKNCAHALLLVDDVRTTGATLREAEEVLKAAGAEVHAIALAQAPSAH